MAEKPPCIYKVVDKLLLHIRQKILPIKTKRGLLENICINLTPYALYLNRIINYAFLNDDTLRLLSTQVLSQHGLRSLYSALGQLLPFVVQEHPD